MDQRRRLSFGRTAEQYDRLRPSYPPRLVEDVIALAGGAPLRALEVGAGTGKATVLFAQRGVAIDAVEPSAGMAARLRVNTAEKPNVTIFEQEFEAYTPARSYELLFSAQAWHWIDPDRRLALARAALSTGGLLAAFWNRPMWDRTPLRDALDGVYTRLAPELAEGPMQPRSGEGPGKWGGEWTDEIEAAPGFDAPEVRRYEWQTSYTAREYTELLATHSDHALLDPDRRATLLAGVAAVIDDSGGEHRAWYVTQTCLARAV